MRLGLVASNPVRGMPKLREAGRRLLFVPFDGAEESALREALAIDLRRFSRSAPTLDSVEGADGRSAGILQTCLVALSQWDVRKRCFAADPMNSVVRSVLFDRGAPDDPKELIFRGAYRAVAGASERCGTSPSLGRGGAVIA
jgi:hypothetical protein